MCKFNVQFYLRRFECHHFQIKKKNKCNLNSKTQENLKNLKIEKNENLKNVNL